MTKDEFERLKERLAARATSISARSADDRQEWKKTRSGRFVRVRDEALLSGTPPGPWEVTLKVPLLRGDGAFVEHVQARVDALYPPEDPTRLVVLEALPGIARRLERDPLRFYQGFAGYDAVVVERDAPTPQTDLSPGQRHLSKAEASVVEDLEGRPVEQQIERLLMAAIIGGEGGLFRGEVHPKRANSAVFYWLVERTGPPPWHHSCSGSPLPLVEFRTECWPMDDVLPPLSVCLAAALLCYARLSNLDLMVNAGRTPLPQRPPVNVPPLRPVK